MDDNRYIVELAVAGFGKDDIEITREKNTLVIKGVKEEEEIGQAQYLHRGIAARNFTKTITIADTIEVHSSELKEGILRVGLINVIPEHQKPKRIEYKLKRDTLRMIEKVEVVKWKTEKRKNTKPNILLLVLGFVVGMFTAFLLRNFKTIL